ncbi:MAG: fasciclin domain-containing protein [Acidimicrobiales bacterium]|nr:fasciclin domain-containing protein [Acidimicrobiales bacterium]
MMRRFEPLLVLVIVLALVLVVGAVLLRDDTTAPSFDEALALGDPEAPLALPTPDAEPTEVPVEAMSITVGLGGSVTVSGRVPDEDTHTAVIEAVTQSVPDTDIVDQVSVVETVVPDGATATLTGSAETAEVAAGVVDALEALGFAVVNQVTVGGQAATVAVVLDSDERLSRFRELIQQAGLAERLEAEGPITVFAPTNEALDALDPSVAQLLEDPERLEELLLGHLTDTEVFAADLSVPQELTMGNGETLALAGDTTVGGAPVVEADVLAGNGVVHLLGGVVLTGAAQAEVELNELVQAQPVQFGPGSAQLVDTAVLDAVAQILLDSPDTLVEVQGHTDTDGEADDNEALSQARAEAVVVYLTARGVDPERLTAVGYGETRPRIDPEVTPEDKAANRRIEFRVTSSLVGAEPESESDATPTDG